MYYCLHFILIQSSQPFRYCGDTLGKFQCYCSFFLEDGIYIYTKMEELIIGASIGMVIVTEGSDEGRMTRGDLGKSEEIIEDFLRGEYI